MRIVICGAPDYISSVRAYAFICSVTQSVCRYCNHQSRIRYINQYANQFGPAWLPGYATIHADDITFHARHRNLTKFMHDTVVTQRPNTGE